MTLRRSDTSLGCFLSLSGERTSWKLSSFGTVALHCIGDGVKYQIFHLILSYCFSLLNRCCINVVKSVVKYIACVVIVNVNTGGYLFSQTVLSIASIVLWNLNKWLPFWLKQSDSINALIMYPNRVDLNLDEFLICIFFPAVRVTVLLGHVCPAWISLCRCWGSPDQHKWLPSGPVAAQWASGCWQHRAAGM